MRTIIKIKRKYAEFDNGDKINLEEYLLDFGDMGMFRADYLLQMFYDLKGRPSQFSIARKLDKYAQNTKK